MAQGTNAGGPEHRLREGEHASAFAQLTIDNGGLTGFTALPLRAHTGGSHPFPAVLWSPISTALSAALRNAIHRFKQLVHALFVVFRNNDRSMRPMRRSNQAAASFLMESPRASTVPGQVPQSQPAAAAETAGSEARAARTHRADSLSEFVTLPTAPGGIGGNGQNGAGGNGGAALVLNVANNLQLDGSISANGVTGPGINSGGGAGGSVALTMGTFAGAGSISVNGGAGNDSLGGGGAGGRVAILSNTNLFSGIITGHGGAGANFGGAGTIYLARMTNRNKSLSWTMEEPAARSRRFRLRWQLLISPSLAEAFFPMACRVLFRWEIS